MRLEIKKGNWDLIWIFILSFLFAVVILLLPDMELLRLIIGIPFLVLFPGYVLVSLLFPRKYIEEPEEEEPVHEKRKRGFRFRQKDEEEGTSSIEVPKNKTINIPTRIALSIGLSLGIVPVLGYILNELYRLNSTYFGLRTAPILISIYSFTMLFGLLAIIRRQRIPKEERFQVGIRIGPFSDGTRSDRLITSVLVILIIIFSVSALYLWKYHHSEGEKYTEFFLLGPEGSISDYPKRFHVNENRILQIGITNNEFKDKHYTIRIFLDQDTGEKIQVYNFGYLKMKPNDIYETDRIVEDGRTIMMEMNFQILEPGSPVMNFVLYLDEKPYRFLKFKPQVFENQDLIFNDERNVSCFLTGSNGIPSDIPDNIAQGELLEMEVGMVDYNIPSLSFNTYLSISNPEVWVRRNMTTNIANLTPDNGSFSHTVISSNIEIITPYHIQLPNGIWELKIIIDCQTFNFSFKRTINVR
ncbi:MAG: DUF1616 domain-containing protein [Candidatus Thermoplasmatota archaeon]|nr:DUF1616 domain-containing protein [Candidatus Thermoplasmatota archaeon]